MTNHGADSSGKNLEPQIITHFKHHLNTRKAENTKLSSNPLVPKDLALV